MPSCAWESACHSARALGWAVVVRALQEEATEEAAWSGTLSPGLCQLVLSSFVLLPLGCCFRRANTRQLAHQGCEKDSAFQKYPCWLYAVQGAGVWCLLSYLTAVLVSRLGSMLEEARLSWHPSMRSKGPETPLERHDGLRVVFGNR